MHKRRIAIVFGLCAFLSAPLFARSKQSKAISGCNSALAICIDNAQGKPYTERILREKGCLNTWNACMDKAGAPKANRRNPLVRPSIDTGKAPISGARGEATPTPPKIGAGEKGLSGRPLTNSAASPTVTPRPSDTTSTAKKPLGARKLKASPTPKPTP